MISERGIMKRFIFTLHLEIYNKLRQKAFDRNISMARYVLEALVWRLEQEVD